MIWQSCMQTDRVRWVSPHAGILFILVNLPPHNPTELRVPLCWLLYCPEWVLPTARLFPERPGHEPFREQSKGRVGSRIGIMQTVSTLAEDGDRLQERNCSGKTRPDLSTGAQGDREPMIQHPHPRI